MVITNCSGVKVLHLIVGQCKSEGAFPLFFLGRIFKREGLAQYFSKIILVLRGRRFLYAAGINFYCAICCFPTFDGVFLG